MYTTIRRYHLERGSMDELLHLVDEGFAEQIQEMDGFVAYECVVDGDELCTISVFRDRASAEATTQAAADWIRENVGDKADLTRTDVFTGEVAVSRAQSAMLEPAHA